MLELEHCAGQMCQFTCLRSDFCERWRVDSARFKEPGNHNHRAKIGSLTTSALRRRIFSTRNSGR